MAVAEVVATSVDVAMSLIGRGRARCVMCEPAELRAVSHIYHGRTGALCVTSSRGDGTDVVMDVGRRRQARTGRQIGQDRRQIVLCDRNSAAREKVSLEHEALKSGNSVEAIAGC